MILPVRKNCYSQLIVHKLLKNKPDLAEFLKKEMSAKSKSSAPFHYAQGDGQEKLVYFYKKIKDNRINEREREPGGKKVARCILF